MVGKIPIIIRFCYTHYFYLLLTIGSFCMVKEHFTDSVVCLEVETGGATKQDRNDARPIACTPYTIDKYHDKPVTYNPSQWSVTSLYPGIGPREVNDPIRTLNYYHFVGELLILQELILYIPGWVLARVQETTTSELGVKLRKMEICQDIFSRVNIFNVI